MDIFALDLEREKVDKLLKIVCDNILDVYLKRNAIDIEAQSLLNSVANNGIEALKEEDKNDLYTIADMHNMRDATPEEREAVNNYIKNISTKVLQIPVRDDDTNGDVMRKVFPDILVENKGAVVRVLGMGTLGIQEFSRHWWSSKYKFPDKNKENESEE